MVWYGVVWYGMVWYGIEQLAKYQVWLEVLRADC